MTRVCAQAGQAASLTLAPLRVPGEFSLAADPARVETGAVVECVGVALQDPGSEDGQGLGLPRA